VQREVDVARGCGRTVGVERALAQRGEGHAQQHRDGERRQALQPLEAGVRVHAARTERDGDARRVLVEEHAGHGCLRNPAVL